MNRGRLLVEGTPAEITHRLEGRVLEVAAEPRRLVERLAKADPEVEDAQSFGDRLHLRVAAGSSREVSSRLTARVREEGGVIKNLRPIAPGLEDVFIELLQVAGTDQPGG